MGLIHRNTTFTNLFGDPDRPIYGNEVVVATPLPTPTPSSTPSPTPTPTPSPTPVFNPASISGIMAWYDTDDSSTISEVSNKVSRIIDKSGNLFHLEQNTDQYKPIYSSDTIGTYIEFEPTNNQRLSNNTISGYSSLTAITKFIVFEKASSYSNEEMIFQIASTGRIHYYWTNYGSSETLHGFDYPGPRWSGIFSYGAYPNYLNWSYMTKPLPYNFDGNLNDVPANTLVSDNWGPIDVDVFSMGARENGGNPTKAKIREVIFYDRELTTSEINQVEGYLKTKWRYSAW